MTLPITISEDTTLGEAHAGMTLVVDSGDITLPKEDTHKYMCGDKFEIISDTIGSVTVSGEEGVTVYPLSNATITSKGSSVKVQYQGNNTYLMWGSLCIALLIGMATLSSNYKNYTLPTGSVILISEGR